MSYIESPSIYRGREYTVISEKPHEIPRASFVELQFEMEPKNFGKESITTKFKVSICDNTAKVSEITSVSRQKRVRFCKGTFNLPTKKDFSIAFTNECSIELTQYATSEKIVISIGESIIKVDGVNKISYSHPC